MKSMCLLYGAVVAALVLPSTGAVLMTPAIPYRSIADSPYANQNLSPSAEDQPSNAYYEDLGSPIGWRIRAQSEWYAHLFRDPAFRAKVVTRWRAVKATQIDTLLAFVDQTAAGLDASQRENFKRWDILNTYVWPNAVVTGSYGGEVAYVKDWLKKRIQWMDKNIKK